MKTKRALVTIAFATAILAIILVGCEGDQGPQGSAGPQGPSGNASVYIIAELRTHTLNPPDSVAEVSVSVYESEEIPHVTINEISLPHSNVQHDLYPFTFYDDSFPISTGEQAQLVVSWGDDAAANSTIILPGLFELLSPNPNYSSIPIQDSLFISWSASEGVSFYDVCVSMGFASIDTSGNPFNFNHSLDTLTTGNELLLPEAVLFPDTIVIEYIIFGYCQIWLYAITGPILEGDQSNISGDASGMFNGITFAGEKSFTWQQPSTTAIAPIPPDLISASTIGKRMAGF